MTTAFNAWEYRPDADYRSDTDVVSYQVEATDGQIGKVDEDTHETGFSCLVVDTGPWIFGKKVMLPAGTIRQIDHGEKKVFVDCTKEQIKNAPEFNPDMVGKPDYQEQLGTYYADTYRGHMM
jgi:hypothetical protein